MAKRNFSDECKLVFHSNAREYVRRLIGEIKKKYKLHEKDGTIWCWTRNCGFASKSDGRRKVVEADENKL